MTQEVHRAAHHGEALRVARVDGVAAVLVRELHEDRLGLGAATRADEQLPQLEPHATSAHALRRFLRIEQRDGRVDLPLRRQRTGLQRECYEPLRSAAGHRLCRQAVGVREAPLVERLVRDVERRGGRGRRGWLLRACRGREETETDEEGQQSEGALHRRPRCNTRPRPAL